jgi:L,D-transpeptidase catalytic domain
MSRFVVAFAAVGFVLAGLFRADAAVVITVNKSTQRLSVAIDGVKAHEWPVSTARWGYNTPNGTYQPERLARKWYSRKYHWSPMPYSIFFHEGYAIHGSYEVSRLGRPASHGCIRLQPKNAAVLFKLVKANRNDTQIVVTGERPSRRVVARHTRHQEMSAHRYRKRHVRRHYADFGDLFFGGGPR